MQNDDVIWQIINHQFCSFKTKVAKERTFCQNPYNVTGLCIRSACPLANSRYATIREHDGDCYLYVKTVERAHTPRNLWEKIKLPSDYSKALALVSAQLQYFPKYLVHRNKQRLTKIHQMLIRMRKLKLQARPQIETTNRKLEKRERGREKKALAAAQLEKAIENELLERLRQATEGEIFNYPERQYSKALNAATNSFEKSGGEQFEDPDAAEEEEEEEDEEELEEEEEEGELEEEEEEASIPDYNVEYIEDFEESDDGSESGDDDGSAEEESKRSSSNSSSARKPATDAADLEALAAKWMARHGGKLQRAAAAVNSSSSSSSGGRKRKEIEYEAEGEEVEENVRETARLTAAATKHNSSNSSSGRKSARLSAAANANNSSMHFNF